MVLSADALIYGGLVASRTHELSDDVLLVRTQNFQRLKVMNSAAPIYVFSTIMRSPHASSGGVEPPYYEIYGPDIFRINALQDKQEVEGLSKGEEQELNQLVAEVPKEILHDWYERREKNLKVNMKLVGEAKQNLFAYLLIGRDDASPYSRSHQESRWLSRETAGLAASQYLSFPGADQLGMVLLARAANDIMFKIPSFAIRYTKGVGEKTIPSYEDVEIDSTVRNHIIAAGGVPLLSEKNADIILAVHTPADGWTREAGGVNSRKVNSETVTFVKQMQSYLHASKKVAVADIAFANGADNSLMAEMTKNKLVSKLESYSGWNTASNTIGYTIGQAIFAQNMTARTKQSLLALRLLDDWAYQANIRSRLLRNVLIPQGHSDVQLNELGPELAAETVKQMNVFAQHNLDWFPLRKIDVSFPWNRMFEVKIKVQ